MVLSQCSLSKYFLMAVGFLQDKASCTTSQSQSRWDRFGFIRMSRDNTQTVFVRRLLYAIPIHHINTTIRLFSRYQTGYRPATSDLIGSTTRQCRSSPRNSCPSIIPRASNLSQMVPRPQSRISNHSGVNLGQTERNEKCDTRLYSSVSHR